MYEGCEMDDEELTDEDTVSSTLFLGEPGLEAGMFENSPSPSNGSSALDAWQQQCIEIKEEPREQPRLVRRNLTLNEKLKVVEQVESGRSRTTICKEYGIPHSTLCDMLSKKDQIRFAITTFTGKLKRLKVGKYPELEAELWNWYCDQVKKKNRPIGPEICHRAVEIAAQMKIVGFNPSSGWLSRFRTRRGLVTPRVKSTEETSDDVCTTARDERGNVRTRGSCLRETKSRKADVIVRPEKQMWTSSIVPEILRRYQPKDIFTTCETGLFYRCSPEKMSLYLREDCSDGRFANCRLTVLVTTNLIGTEKLPVLAIGKYAQPRCFKNLKAMPTEYRANAKSWMVAPYFEQWIRKLDNAMAEANRNIVLFVTASESHPRVPDLQAVSIIFLPPDKKLNPANQGIIQTLKQNYRRSIIHRRLHFSEVNGPNEDCDITLLDGLHWLRSAWKDVSPRCIYKSFQNAKFDLPSYESLVPRTSSSSSSTSMFTSSADELFQLECDEVLANNLQVTMDAEYKRLFEQLAKSLNLDPFITAELYSSLDDGVVTSGKLTEEELAEVLSRVEADEEDDEVSSEEKEQEKEEAVPPPTIADARRCLSRLAKYFAQEKGTEKYFDKIASLYHHTREIKTAQEPTSNIIDIFQDMRGRRKKPESQKKKKKSSLPVLDA